jgi:hypothetical protein
VNKHVHIKNKKQSRQKPPLRADRIAGEILVGIILGFATLPVIYIINIMIFGKSDFSGSVGGLHAFAFLGILIFLFPPLYVLGCAIGVSLVGDRGEQTGSFLAALGGGFLGLIVILLKWPLAFLTVPIMAALGFNLTRKYKVQKKQTNFATSVARIALMVLAVCSIVPIWMYGSDIGVVGFIIPVILLILALALK